MDDMQSSIIAITMQCYDCCKNVEFVNNRLLVIYPRNSWFLFNLTTDIDSDNNATVLTYLQLNKFLQNAAVLHRHRLSELE